MTKYSCKLFFKAQIKNEQKKGSNLYINKLQ